MKELSIEEKELLLKDLCARLTHGIKVWYKYGAWYPEKFATSIRLADEKIALSSNFNREGDWFPVEEAGEILIKPYLRPMSSMTEEEQIKFSSLCELTTDSNGEKVWSVSVKGYDWLNANFFDYRGLIEKGLAIEVTTEYNPYK